MLLTIYNLPYKGNKKLQQLSELPTTPQISRVATSTCNPCRDARSVRPLSNQPKRHPVGTHGRASVPVKALTL